MSNDSSFVDNATTMLNIMFPDDKSTQRTTNNIDVECVILYFATAQRIEMNGEHMVVACVHQKRHTERGVVVLSFFPVAQDGATQYLRLSYMMTHGGIDSTTVAVEKVVPRLASVLPRKKLAT